ncbi:MAG: leucine-rich repeat domain-containing protein [Sedimentisphaerales bacterium]|nr:leucine-rich repeat domain-containing protein [Sedimentisphaerales bacterium]
MGFIDWLLMRLHCRAANQSGGSCSSVSDGSDLTAPPDVRVLTLVRRAKADGWTELCLGYRGLTMLPEYLRGMTPLQRLDLSNNQLTTLPEWLGEMIGLEYLSLSYNQLVAVPESIGNLTNLKTLSLNDNQLLLLPDSLGNLVNLTELWLGDNQLKSLPDSLGNLVKLERLTLWKNQLTTIPESIGRLVDLTEFYLSVNHLGTLPESIGKLVKLTHLCLARNQLKSVPESLGNLTNIIQLSLAHNQLTSLPEFLGNLVKLHELDVKENELRELPKCLRKLRSLEILDVGDNPLASVHPGIRRIKDLRGVPEEKPSERHLYCEACDEGTRVSPPRERPPFGTPIVCATCHAALLPIGDATEPRDYSPSDVSASLGYADCSLGHPRCPWCLKVNHCVVFPENGTVLAWCARQKQANPGAAFVIDVACVHCNRRFVVEWDQSPVRADSGAGRFQQLCEELCHIGLNRTLPERVAFSGFFSSQSILRCNEHPRAMSIGEVLYEMGNHKLVLMLRAHEYVAQRLGEAAASDLSCIWHNIGSNYSEGECWLR